MTTFSVAGNNYTSRKMSAFAQFHVARRLGPIFSSIAESFKKVRVDGQGTIENPLDIFEPIAESFAALKDADAEYVLNSCLITCQRQNNNLWSDVMSSTGALMFQDIDLKAMMQIAWNVLQDNFSSFFSGNPVPNLKEANSKA